MLLYNIKSNLIQGFAFAALLLTAVVCMSGCGKADKAYQKAMELAEEGKYEKAVSSFEEAIKENDEKAEYYIGYGMTLDRMGKYKKAIKQFDKAYQEVDNKISRQNNKRLYYGQAIAYYGLHQYDKAAEQCEKALEISENEDMNGNIYTALALSQWAIGDTKKAQQTFDQLLKEDNKDVDAYLQRGRMYLSIGDLEAASKDFDQAIKLDEDCHDAFFGRYDVYMAAGQEDAAKEMIEQIAGLHAKKPEEKLQTGHAYCLLGDFEQAESDLNEAVKGKCYEGYYYLGVVRMAKQDFEKAYDYFVKYIESRNGDVTSLSIPEVYIQLAGCCIEQRDFEKAEDYLAQGLDMGVTSAYQGLLKNQVILWERQAKYVKAQEAAQTYLEAYPEDEEMKKELEFIGTRIKKK